MTPNDIVIYPQISASLSPQWRSFFLQEIVINIELHNCWYCAEIERLWSPPHSLETVLGRVPYVIHVWPLSSHKVLVSFLLMKMETSRMSCSRWQSCGVEICSQVVGMAASHAKWPIHRGGHPWNAWQTLRGYLIIILFSTASTKMIHESAPNLEFMGIFSCLLGWSRWGGLNMLNV